MYFVVNIIGRNILQIGDFDTEACGGTHEDDTSEIGEIMITRAERIQDGIVRLTYTAGPATDLEKRRINGILSESEKSIGSSRDNILKDAEKTFKKWKELRKKVEKNTSESSEKIAKEMEKNFAGNFLAAKVDNADPKLLQEISKQLSNDDRVIVLIGTKEKAFVFVSSGADTKINAGKLSAEVCESLGGKGR